MHKLNKYPWTYTDLIDILLHLGVVIFFFFKHEFLTPILENIPLGV